MTKPLIFNDTPKPVISPGKIKFDDTPLDPITSHIKFMEEVKQDTKTGNIKFTDTPKTPGTLLFSEPQSPLLKLSLEKSRLYITDQSIKEKIERQIKQLSDLNVDEIMRWGAPAVQDEVDATMKITEMIAAVSNLNANEIINKILKQVDGKNTVFEKLFVKEVPIDSLKNELTKLKRDIEKLFEYEVTYRPILEDAEQRLKIFICSLKSVEEAAKEMGSYDRVEDLMYNRRVLLLQATQQSDLTRGQLDQTIKLMRSHLEKIEQLLMITIPAFLAIQVNTK